MSNEVVTSNLDLSDRELVAQLCEVEAALEMRGLRINDLPMDQVIRAATRRIELNEVLRSTMEKIAAGQFTESGAEEIAKAALVTAGKRGHETALIQPDGWRTIETAPKDGSRIHLGFAYCQNFDVIAHWSTRLGAWMLTGDDDDGRLWGRGEPSHWRPLPTPPKREVEKELRHV
jgi:hypothetical protein